MAPEEDIDMDLDPDRQVLLSLPVTNTIYDAVHFLVICFYKLLINQRGGNEIAYVFCRNVFWNSSSHHSAGVLDVPENRGEAVHRKTLG